MLAKFAKRSGCSVGRSANSQDFNPRDQILSGNAFSLFRDGEPGRNVFEPWEFLKFIVNFKDVSLRSNGFYQL